MITLTLVFLAVGLLFYTLLGGADFGAGVLEIFMGKKSERTVSKAMAPVWEANHVWLILVVVIVFNVFPKVYSTLSTALHIPLFVVLIGIIFRGTAFTFRYYDVAEGKPHRVYTFFFRISSVITPLFLGITLGAMMLGRVTLDAELGFYEIFIAPWFNWFSLSVGIFSVSLFTYLATIFLIGEASAEDRPKYVRAARIFLFVTLLLGVFVFVAAAINGIPLLDDYLNSRWSLVAMGVATLLIPVILFLMKKNKKHWLRIVTGIQVANILLGWGAMQYPIFIYMRNGEHLTLFNTAAPEHIFYYLIIALVVGSLMIFPGIYFLFKVFKS